jgi:hypothetical protein
MLRSHTHYLYTNSNNIVLDIFGWTGCCSYLISAVSRWLSVVGCLLPRGCVSRSVGSLVLCVGGVAFGLCGSRCAVIHAVNHAVGLLSAEWLR